MTRKLVIANWKMNGSLAGNADLIGGFATTVPAAVDVVVCPPFPYLAQVATLLEGSSISLGAQNLSAHAAGAHTGEVSAAMLADVGCRYVIVGHSERRAMQGEGDELVAAKAVAALEVGLVPVVCVGETLAERDQGRADATVSTQLDVVLSRMSARKDAAWVVAYEPVWAIGTGRAASLEQVSEMHALIRARLVGVLGDSVPRVLYGGSVKPEGASALFALPGVDGGLIGGASLSAGDFLSICQAAA